MASLCSPLPYTKAMALKAQTWAQTPQPEQSVSLIRALPSASELMAGQLRRRQTLQLVQAFIRSVLTDKTVKPLFQSIENKKLLKFVHGRIKKFHKPADWPSFVSKANSDIQAKLQPES